ncbi:hypothetical protein VIGAN_01016900 [Vigna angularis var. angularis]|uniref:Response regulatory domain-containing protein n=1 Tax=Vigna angularis var. angularis TaxID=157739 RepID=A0A0S3QWM8_PHAAN|nr:hypothetical protein VIGAN_01016900 [Vigna angularis var. angularis]
MNVAQIIHLVVIDDHPTVLEFFKNYCTTALPIMQSVWYNVTTFLNPGQGWKYVLECKKSKTWIDFIMVETHMLAIDGFAFIDLLNTKHINIPVLLMFKDYSDTSQFEAYKLRACDYWEKHVVELHLKTIKDKIMRETMKLKKRRIRWTDEMKLQFDEVIKRMGLEIMFKDYSDTSQFEAYKLGACDYWEKHVVELHLKTIKD